MNALRTIFAVFFVTLSSQTYAVEEISLGIAALSPSGFTAKFWNSPTTAIDVFGKWQIDSEEANIHADYLIHDFQMLESPGMPFYYGYGIRVLTETDADGKRDNTVGIRLPFGVSLFLENMPFDLFAEVAPRVNVVPSTHFGLDLMIGVRYRIYRSNGQKEAQRNTRYE